MQAHEIAIAFNACNDKKSWTARASSKPEAGFDIVHFQSSSGLVTLSYNTLDGRFQVKFNKYQAAWGDYIKAISRSLYVVLTTLKGAGLPFEAPLTPAGIVIEATNTESNTVFVRWPGQEPRVASPLYPVAFGAAYGDGGPNPFGSPYPTTAEEAIMPELQNQAPPA